MLTYVKQKRGMLLTGYRLYENLIDPIKQNEISSKQEVNECTSWTLKKISTKSSLRTTRESCVLSWTNLANNTHKTTVVRPPSSHLEIHLRKTNPAYNTHKTTVVLLPSSHLEIYLCKTNKTCGVLLEKQRRIYKKRSLMDTYKLTCQC